MTIVVDASVAIKWVLEEEHSAVARALHSERLTAPALWLAECGNVLWKRTRRGELAPDEARDKLDALSSAPVVTTPLDPDLSAALTLANALGHPVYDCLYLAAAIREDAVVVTADARFVRAVEGTAYAGRVRRLGA